MCGCTKFQAKQITLTFPVQIYLEMDLGMAIQKTNVGIRISIVKMPCKPIFRKKKKNFDFFDKNLPKNGFWGQNLKKSKSGFRICILEILFAPIFRQNKQLWIFGTKFAQKWILGLGFQKSKSEFGINTFNIPCVPIFSQNG